jgi:hypothetical protein
MPRFLFWLSLLCILGCKAERTPSINNAAGQAARPCPSGIVWSALFDDTTVMTSKESYLHLLWNMEKAIPVMGSTTAGDFYTCAVPPLLSKVAAAGMKEDECHIDIVQILSKDQYGMPVWSSVKRIASIAVRRSAIAQLSESAKSNPDEIRKVFLKIELQ